MNDLRQQLQTALCGNIGFVGLGNPDLGDDVAGLFLARCLAARGVPNVLVAGTQPERVALRTGDRFDQVVFLDAVEFGACPGAVVFLDAKSVQTRFPQVSTHKIALGTLACLVESSGRARAWLLGIQPGSLRPGRALAGGVRRTVELLTDILCQVVPAQDNLAEAELETKT
jgi:hydrogenase maturation protease